MTNKNAPKRNIGGLFKGIKGRLRALGVPETIINQAVRVITVKPKKLRVGARVKARLAELLTKPGDKCIVALSPRGKLRVTSFSGYFSQKENGERLRKHPTATLPVAPPTPSEIEAEAWRP